MDAPLDYVTIQILLEQNRYEAFICCDNQVEKLEVGNLEKILPHLPGLYNLYTKGYNANYKLESPKQPAPSWFSKATFTRFLHIIGSTDFVDIAKPIQCELSQLEESRTFHLSIYGHGQPLSKVYLERARNLLRIAIFNISYIRGLFPEKYFNDKSVPALEMKIKKLMPMDAESRRLIDWMEKGVYDALQK